MSPTARTRVSATTWQPSGAHIDPTPKFAVAQIFEKDYRNTTREFLKHMLEAVADHVHSALNERAIEGAIGPSPMASGIQFAEQPWNRNTIHSRPMRFDIIYEANGIVHRLTKPNYPWSHEDQKSVQWTDFPSGGQVKRMNRTIKDTTDKRFHYKTHDQLRTHLADFLATYNFARRLKTFGGLTPYEYICKV